MNKMYKTHKLIGIKEDGTEEELCDLGDAISLNIKNNLLPVEKQGMMRIAGHVSMGIHYSISSYVKNKNYWEDYEKILNG